MPDIISIFLNLLRLVLWPGSLFSCSIMSDSLWPHGHQTFMSFIISWSLLKLMSIESVMLSNYLVLCCPLLLLPSIFPRIRVIIKESALHIRWLKYWSFSFIVSPSNEYSGLISFRMDWLALLAVQGTLKSLLQHHSSKAPILLWPTMWYILENVPCKLEKNMYSSVFGWNAL